MKPGDVVTIYQDPITRTKPEGKAVLLEMLSDNMGIYEGKTLQYWKVSFQGETEIYQRSILNS